MEAIAATAQKDAIQSTMPRLILAILVVGLGLGRWLWEGLARHRGLLGVKTPYQVAGHASTSETQHTKSNHKQQKEGRTLACDLLLVPRFGDKQNHRNQKSRTQNYTKKSNKEKRMLTWREQRPQANHRNQNSRTQNYTKKGNKEKRMLTWREQRGEELHTEN